MTNFNINEWLTDLPVQTNIYTEVDGEVITEQYKEFNIGEHLRLYLCGDTGQASLDWFAGGDSTFMWDADMERLFADINNVDLAELFTAMHVRRWEGVYDV